MKNIFKTASLLAAAVVLCSCGGENGDPTGGTDASGDIMIVSDKDVIQSNGQDAATLKVIAGGKDVTAEAVFYDVNNDVVNLPGGQFTATKNGEYKFWATYGTSSTYNKSYDDNGLFTIKAISVPVPEAVADPDPSNTSFEHRAFLIQHTATGCGYCPYVTKMLRQLESEKVIPSRAILAASHAGPFSGSDPARISAPKWDGTYPFLEVDLTKRGVNANNSVDDLKAVINQSIAGAAKAGIAVNPVLYEDDTLVLMVSVKAAVDGIFNVGVWLLEDNIFGQQMDKDNVGDASYNYHHNCLRIANSKYKGTFFGLPVGTLKKGEVAHKTFVMDVNSEDWVVDNLHLAAFVSYGVQRGSSVSYAVCNAIDCPIDEPTPFDYK